MNISDSYLSTLLPYDPSIKKNGDLKACFKQYSLLLEIVIRALDALERGDLEQFDALVGENACQIRAVKVAMIAQKCLESVRTIWAEVEDRKGKIATLSGSLEKTMKRGESFQTLLKEQLDIPLSRDMLFLVESCLLSISKKVLPPKRADPLCRNEESCPKKLQELSPGISGSFAGDLVKKTKELLSASSVAFVQAEANALDEEKLKIMCSEGFIAFDGKKQTIPMFWTYKTLLMAAEKAGIPLVIDAKFLNKDYECVDEESMFFRANNSSYEEVPSCLWDQEKAAIIVQGVALLPEKNEWRRTVASLKTKVILAGAADHRQYPDERDLRIEQLRDMEFESYRQMARDQGFALENPSVFFIQHVFSAYYFAREKNND